MQANPSQPADFMLVNRVLLEMKTTGRSPSLQKWAVDAQTRLAEYRAANGLKVKKECDAVELGLQRTIELIEAIRTATVKPG